MAKTNRVYVSPGVYTHEDDLTYVAQSIGVTTLGIVGETLKGPAFENILVTNYDTDVITYFGGTSPEKDGVGNPKYELGYVAKSYLQQSNQMFITRVLGLTGFKPYKTFGIKTIGGVTVDTNIVTSVVTSGLTPTTLGITGSTFYSELTNKTASDGATSITDYLVTNFSGLTNSDSGKYFTIGPVPTSGTTSLTGTTLVSPIDLTNNKSWYNTYYFKTGSTIDTVNGVYSYLFVWSSGTTSFNVTRYKYSASLNDNNHNVTVATLRPRGNYAGENLIFEVTGNTSFTLTNTSTEDITINPLGEFNINVTGRTGGMKSFITSLDVTSSKYLTKVFGTKPFDKPKSDYPLYVHEVYPNSLKKSFESGEIIGLSLTPTYQLEGNNFVKQWDTPISPMVVSEVRGGTVSDLYQFIPISDGDSANTLIKITHQNLDLDSGEFDIIIRDFNDTDDVPVTLERFTRCSLNPDSPGYIAKKIGTSDGEFKLKSKHVMLLMVDNHPTDAIPSGFRGFVTDNTFSGTTLGNIQFKTTFYDAGDIIGYNANGSAITTNGDKIKKVTFGLSNQIGYDSDLFKFKGNDANGATHGFHLSTNASTITGNTLSGLEFQTTPYDLEGLDKGKLTTIAYRKFTMAVAGGFDGWDIYRTTRTFSDDYIFGKSKYVSGHTTNGGVFSSTVGNSDYYAYLQAIQTFANPEAIDINVFATAGIDFYNHSSLVSQAIDMVENDRADSIYIVNSPNYSTTDEIVDALDSVSIDSSYTSTYWPWIQIRDTDNASQLYIPPTAEVLKNIALTDNVDYPWFAVGGYKRGLVTSIKAIKKLTGDDRDTLYKNRINPIATFSDTGTIIWGNKTLQQRESATDRMNVRRLLLRTRKIISNVALRLLFDQNDEQVRSEFLRMVNPILESIKKERGLYDFQVRVSNDPEDIDANTLRATIYLKPVKTLEMIEIGFTITPTGTSFDNL